MSARDELIADWQQCLTAAEALAAESPRFAWLARVRIRLYRFLLACYGAGDWNASPSEAPPPTSSSAVIFDSADALPLRGKPAKSAGKIQAVLKAVANAQDQTRRAGPLAAGLGPHDWVIAATASSGVHFERYSKYLNWAGISVRIRDAGYDDVLEVPAHAHGKALQILADSHERLHRLHTVSPRAARWRLAVSTLLSCFWVVCVGVVVAITNYHLVAANDPQRADQLRQIAVVSSFLGLTLIAFLLASGAGKLLSKLREPILIRKRPAPILRVALGLMTGGMALGAVAIAFLLSPPSAGSDDPQLVEQLRQTMGLAGLFGFAPLVFLITVYLGRIVAWLQQRPARSTSEKHETHP